jgi:hypothetical protein
MSVVTKHKHFKNTKSLQNTEDLDLLPSHLSHRNVQGG